jgi:hypothetical protein
MVHPPFSRRNAKLVPAPKNGIARLIDRWLPII